MRIDWEDEPDLEAFRLAKASLSTNAAKGLDTLKALAERGSSFSAIALAKAAEKGMGGAPDLGTCEKWLRSAADKGSRQASYSLGRVYLRMGQYARAHDAFVASAAKDYAPAQLVLGQMYLKGFVVEKNVDRAIEHLEQASAQNHIYAKGVLAKLYLHGESGWFFGGLLEAV